MKCEGGRGNVDMTIRRKQRSIGKLEVLQCLTNDTRNTLIIHVYYNAPKGTNIYPT